MASCRFCHLTRVHINSSEAKRLAQVHEAGKPGTGVKSSCLTSPMESRRAADPQLQQASPPPGAPQHSCPAISISESIPETQLPGDGLGPSQPGVGSSSGIQICRNEGLGPRAASWGVQGTRASEWGRGKGLRQALDPGEVEWGSLRQSRTRHHGQRRVTSSGPLPSLSFSF